MKLYLLSQGYNNGYYSFDSCVVAAETEEDARLIHPIFTWSWSKNEMVEGHDYSKEPDVFEKHDSCWVKSPDLVDVEYLGTAKRGTERGVILASFNAG